MKCVFLQSEKLSCFITCLMIVIQGKYECSPILWFPFLYFLLLCLDFFIPFGVSGRVLSPSQLHLREGSVHLCVISVAQSPMRALRALVPLVLLPASWTPPNICPHQSLNWELTTSPMQTESPPPLFVTHLFILNLNQFCFCKKNRKKQTEPRHFLI